MSNAAPSDKTSSGDSGPKTTPSPHAEQRPAGRNEPHDIQRPSHLVAIGASAGGLESLERFFRALPESTGIAFVVIQHLSPDFKSLMDELLGRYTKLPVVQVLEEALLEADHIYLLPPGKELTTDGHHLYSGMRSKDGSLFLPINLFFRSLAATWSEKAVAVVLSGTGSDGTNGALDIRDAGGVVIAESPDTAGFMHMPQSVINTGCADAILAPEEIPQYIIDNAPHPGSARLAEMPPDAETDKVARILELLRKAYRIDFNHYKSGTIMRRIERRVMGKTPDGIVTLEDYHKQLSSSPQALDLLYKDLLIGVTRFFRDPEAFSALERKVVPNILDQVQEDEEVRIWVCGCSTGEEAYSIAALFMSALTKRERPAMLKVLATDLHEDSLQTAALGTYDETSFADMPAELRERYFEPLPQGRLRVLPELRKSLIFSRHNLLNDPPFTKIHLVSCRNLLIYLKPAAQARAIASFHYALKVNGVMFLGASESLGELEDEFETLDRHWKLFRKRHEGRLFNMLKTPHSDLFHQRKATSRSGRDPMQGVYDALLSAFMPTGLLINHEKEVLHIFGDAQAYLKPDQGRFTGLLSNQLRKELKVPLISALRNAEQHMEEVELKGLEVKRQDRLEHIGIRVVPIKAKNNRDVYFMVVMQPEDAPSSSAQPVEHQDFDLQSEVREYIQELELELQRARETLQSTVEELETSNEELQASNEELLASNEELQSTNEELHSVNEELYSVNAEHEIKIAELNKTGNDLRNLVQSTDTATIFVDLEGLITLYTPQALEIFDLIQQDIGRPLRNFRARIKDETLFSDLEALIREGTPMGRYLSQTGDQSYLRRCSLMQDSAGRPCGIVINYTDTTQISRANRALDESEARFSLILQTAPNGILVLDRNLDVVIANRYAENLFGHPSGNLIGVNIRKLILEDPEQDLSLEQQFAADTEDASHLAQPLPMEARRLDATLIPIQVSVGRLSLDGKPYSILAATPVKHKREGTPIERQGTAGAQTLLPDTRPAARADDLEGVRICVAEDDTDNQLILVGMLEELKASCLTFGNGKELVEHVERHGREECDLVLMDIQMPVMNGHQAAKQLLRKHPELPIIGISAYASTADRDTCLAAGMRDYIAKPFSTTQLLRVIQKHLGSRGEPAAQETRP